jgi:hypothetical protein
MAKDWVIVMVPNVAAWGLTRDIVTAFDGLADAAQAAMDTAKNETTRTPVATAQCRAAFEALIDKMRDLKRRYFLSPPLTDSDYVSLGLKPHDTNPTPGGHPKAQAAVETFLTGRHELGIKIVYVSGDPHDRANKGFRIYYRVVAPGEAPPTRPEELNQSFFTRRKKDVIAFDYGDSGKTAYFAVQIENDGKKGEWGPMVSALIP